MADQPLTAVGDELPSLPPLPPSSGREATPLPPEDPAPAPLPTPPESFELPSEEEQARMWDLAELQEVSPPLPPLPGAQSEASEPEELYSVLPSHKPPPPPDLSLPSMPESLLGEEQHAPQPEAELTELEHPGEEEIQVTVEAVHLAPLPGPDLENAPQPPPFPEMPEPRHSLPPEAALPLMPDELLQGEEESFSAPLEQEQEQEAPAPAPLPSQPVPERFAPAGEEALPPEQEAALQVRRVLDAADAMAEDIRQRAQQEAQELVSSTRQQAEELLVEMERQQQEGLMRVLREAEQHLAESQAGLNSLRELCGSLRVLIEQNSTPQEPATQESFPPHDQSVAPPLNPEFPSDFSPPQQDFTPAGGDFNPPEEDGEQAGFTSPAHPDFLPPAGEEFTTPVSPYPSQEPPHPSLAPPTQPMAPSAQPFAPPTGATFLPDGPLPSSPYGPEEGEELRVGAEDLLPPPQIDLPPAPEREEGEGKRAFWKR